MAKYTCSHETAAGANLPMINLTGSASIRCNIYDLVFGSDATPADVAGEFEFSRTTDAGTGGSPLTEVALDPLTVAASGAAVGGIFTTNPITTANTKLLTIALNQRATFRWVAAPSSELITAATAANGIQFRCVGMSSGTPNINTCFFWFE